MAEAKQSQIVEVAAKKSPRKLQRSPNYPMFALAEAIEKAKLIYKHELRNFTTADVIQEDLGYKKGTGAAGRAVSALKQYGLVEERSGTYGLSNQGFLFTYAEEESPERIAAIRECALKPQIFREILALYPSGLPSDATLKAHLIGKRKFNPTSVEDFIRILKETISLAKIVPGEYSPSQTSEDAGGGGNVDSTTNNAPASQLKPAVGVHTFTWTLSMPRNVRAELRLVGSDLKKEDVTRLKKQIESIEDSFDE